MDIEALRSFVIAADSGQLQHAAAELGVTQQVTTVESIESGMGGLLGGR